MKRIVWVVCVALGCASGGGSSFTPAQLPPDPIALVYRKGDDVEKVQKQLDARRQRMAEEKRGEVQRARPAPGSIEAIRESLDLRAEENASIDLLTRMALYFPQEERTVDADFGAKGDRPLAWSADHQRLLFASERTGQTQLFEWNRQTDAAPQLTTGEDPVLDGCYGPNGEVAYSLGGRLQETPSGVVGGMRIWVRRPGESDPRPVTPGPIDVAPAWSPSEPLLVYQARGKAGIEEIVAVNPLEPGTPRYLANGRSPVFTPDGKWIVYSSRTNKGWKLARVRADGSGRQVIAGTAQMQEVEPAISRDGKWIVYTGYYEGKPGETDLMVRPFGGGKDRKLDFDDKPHRTTW
jgi:hypothetical protein